MKPNLSPQPSGLRRSSVFPLSEQVASAAGFEKLLSANPAFKKEKNNNRLVNRCIFSGQVERWMFFAPFFEGVRGLGSLFVEEQFDTEIKEMRTENCYAAQHWVWEAALYGSDKVVSLFPWYAKVDI